ncbi:MAG: hypothetical protein L6R42_001143 [Xanthoria sp. 1 TBL-2021]|nr:MAG: hypothetical protein L6R42_001143 [Xanthoria sp. 1 TBL-2021]
MSFNAKNLTYESSDPSFLRKLRGEFGGTDSARQQRPQARPKKLRNADEEDDDQPVYVHDQDPSEALSKAEYDALLKPPSTKQHSAEEGQPDTDVQTFNETEARLQESREGQAQRGLEVKERTAAIGGSSKKRSAKVVADDASSDEVQKPKTESQAAKKQGPKKGKKMKLSFEED